MFKYAMSMCQCSYAAIGWMKPVPSLDGLLFHLSSSPAPDRTTTSGFLPNGCFRLPLLSQFLGRQPSEFSQRRLVLDHGGKDPVQIHGRVHVRKDVAKPHPPL